MLLAMNGLAARSTLLLKEVIIMFYKFFSIVMAFAIILIYSSASLADEPKPVYDDDGKVITEEEIQAYMGNGYRVGCTAVGAPLSLGVSGGLS